MTPLGAGRAAGRDAVEAGAVVLGDRLAARVGAGDAGIVDQVDQVGSSEVEQQAAVRTRAEVGERQAIGGVDVDAAGLQEAGVDIGADHVARGAQP